jgi:hypothetical protein
MLCNYVEVRTKPKLFRAVRHRVPDCLYKPSKEQNAQLDADDALRETLEIATPV